MGGLNAVSDSEKGLGTFLRGEGRLKSEGKIRSVKRIITQIRDRAGTAGRAAIVRLTGPESDSDEKRDEFRE